MFRKLFQSVGAVGLLALGTGMLVSCDSVPEPSPEPTPVSTRIRIAAGEIEGERLDGEPAVHVYRGIPFAAPPVGELRWRPPQSVEPWDGVRPATDFGPMCMQPTFAGFYGIPADIPRGEDCLTLNLWTAAATAEERRPVMVWIHGGGFTVGSSRLELYDGATLAREGAVVVSVNYRLNAFGFLAHPALSAESEHDSSSHYGLLDQVAALEWVRDNVAAFGGDPDRVTIFGESAGSMSVSLLTVTPLARGLFHRAIGESGAAFAPVERLRGDGVRGLSAEAVGEELAKVLGVADAEDVAAAMRARSAQEILDTFQSNPMFGTLWGFTPVDGWVLPAQPREILERGEQVDVPVLIGTNDDEGSVLVDYFPADWRSSLEGYRKALKTNYGDSADALGALYPAAADAEVRGAMAEILADDIFLFPTWAWAHGMASVSSPAWVYRFTKVPAIEEAESYGAYHGAELPYVFGTVWPGAEWDEDDEQLSKTIRGAWLRFAATGDPNGGELPQWPAFTADNEAYLEIGDNPEVKDHLRMEHVQAFDEHYRRMLEPKADTP
jgi:para-nitrobenzyl esterase